MSRGVSIAASWSIDAPLDCRTRCAELPEPFATCLRLSAHRNGNAPHNSAESRRPSAYTMSGPDDEGLRRGSGAHPSDLAVIFDMDGVLVDSEPLHLQALNEVLGPLGHHATAAENEQFLGWTSEECWQVLIERYHLSADNLQQYLAHYDECLLRLLQHPVVPTRGAPELLALLRGLGVRLALASASKRSWLDATLRALGLDRAFDVVVTGDEVVHGKPAPDIFLLAASRLGVSPERCIVIEDSLNGVLAARRAQMTVVALRNPAATNLPLDAADRVIDSLADWDPQQLLKQVALAQQQ